MTEHQLFVFLVQVTTLFLAAKVGGEVAARLRVPIHVGELAAGLLLGPSLLGWIWPEAFRAIFPESAVQRSLIEIVSWTGVMFLVLLGGLETRLGILRSAGRAVLGGWIGGFGLPFLAGFGLGMLFPDSLIGDGTGRPVFALFLATAMAISAIPVIARILMDLRLYRTRVGMVILVAAIADDTIGWIVLALVAGLVAGGVETLAVVRTLTLTAAFIVLAFTVGRRLVRGAMRLAGRRLAGPSPQVSMMLLLVFGAAAITQAIGVHLVLGAFIAAVLIGRTRVEAAARDSVRQVGMGFFIPIFFAFTGSQVDLTSLHGEALLFALLVLVVACAGKIVGGGVGARLGGLPRWESAAVGFGLNARGAMELVIAAIGLSIGVLNDASYAVIVLVAVVTTVMTAPLLKLAMERAGHGAVEEEHVVLADREAAGSATSRRRTERDGSIASGEAAGRGDGAPRGAPPEL